MARIRWRVGGLPTFWQNNQALFDKKFGDELSPLHLDFQAALGDCAAGKKRNRKSSRMLPDNCQTAVLGMGSAV